MRTRVLVLATFAGASLVSVSCQQAEDTDLPREAAKLQAKLDGYEDFERPPVPEELSSPHRRSLQAFRAFCDELSNQCEDALETCLSCDLRQKPCLDLCVEVSGVCDTWSECEVAYSDAVLTAP